VSVFSKNYGLIAIIEKTDTLAYGEHEPFSVPLALCDSCQGKAQLQKQIQEPIRWLVACKGCGKKANQAQKRPWQAALKWNEINLGTQDYKALLLFGLSNASTDDARHKMSGIRRNLELRKNLAGIERTIAGHTNKKAPGKQYQQKLDAYLQWSILALRLIKSSKIKSMKELRQNKGSEGAILKT